MQRATSGTITYLDLDDLLRLAALVPGESPQLRDPGLLGSAVARPCVTLREGDAYGTIELKAAALLQSLIHHAGFSVGNAAVGWLATAVFLELNGLPAADVPGDAAADLAEWVRSDAPPVLDIAARLSPWFPVPSDRARDPASAPAGGRCYPPEPR